MDNFNTHDYETLDSLSARKYNIGLLPLITPTSPNCWDDVSAADFGPEHDFDTEDHGSIIVIDCYSNAALQWCYHHLPEEVSRWGRTGFAIERRYIADIINGMKRDNLMDRKDYTDAMNEMDDLARQWEGQS